MPHLGHSGSGVVVADDYATKTGPGVADQADYCLDLGPGVSPFISRITYSSDSYRMERLQELVVEDIDFRALLLNMTGLLTRHVWSRPVEKQTEDWGGALMKWARDFSCLRGFDGTYLDLYIKPPALSHYCHIHGDPTFANVMTRGDDKQIVLIDPIRPVGKIPPLREVDVGKILQSLLGWEHLLDDRWPVSQTHLINYLFKDADRLTRKRFWFWAAVHCARILPYAHSDRVVQWCEATAKRSLSLAIRL